MKYLIKIAKNRKKVDDNYLSSTTTSNLPVTMSIIRPWIGTSGIRGWFLIFSTVSITFSSSSSNPPIQDFKSTLSISSWGIPSQS